MLCMKNKIGRSGFGMRKVRFWKIQSQDAPRIVEYRELTSSGNSEIENCIYKITVCIKGLKASMLSASKSCPVGYPVSKVAASC